MTDNVENLIIEHLRLMRVELGGIKDDVREIKTRMGSIENTLASVKRDIADLYTEVAGQNVRYDRMVEHFERIGKRLELA